MSKRSWLQFIPTATMSRLAGSVARFPLARPLRAPLFRWMANRLQIDLAEVAHPLNEYRSFDAFFSRSLSAGARDFDAPPGTLSSPADGQLTAFDVADGAEPISVKGARTSLLNWLGAERLPWRHPNRAVVYLSPRDYHRVHSPIHGHLTAVDYHPGSLWPVNPRMVGSGTAVFERNERITMWFETDWGAVAVCMVGAFCVGGMELSIVDLRANRWARRASVTRFAEGEGPRVSAGDELGVFHMGSSVLMAWEGDQFEAATTIVCGAGIRVGNPLGGWCD